MQLVVPPRRAEAGKCQLDQHAIADLQFKKTGRRNKAGPKGRCSSMTKSITRRTMLAGSAASLLVAPWVARAQGNTLKIGMQSILSGPIALLGTSSRNALM